MKLHVDREADALYLRLDDSVIIESEEVSSGVVLDYNDPDDAVGIEMLHRSRRSRDLKQPGLARPGCLRRATQGGTTGWTLISGGLAKGVRSVGAIPLIKSESISGRGVALLALIAV